MSEVRRFYKTKFVAKYCKHLGEKWRYEKYKPKEARLVLEPMARHSLEELSEAMAWYLELLPREKDLKRPLGRGGLKEKLANSSSWSGRRNIP